VRQLCTGEVEVGHVRKYVRVRALAATTVAALLLAGPASAAPPRAGVLVPGASLGGLRLGMTPAQVRSAWGSGYGTCRGCAAPTWYFTYRPFTKQGAGVAFWKGRVAALYTLWSPPGWLTPRGLAIGDPSAKVTELYGAMPPEQCFGYSALLLRHGTTLTAFYIVDQKVYGFGLTQYGRSPCF
jgi:hypothetical protein